MSMFIIAHTVYSQGVKRKGTTPIRRYSTAPAGKINFTLSQVQGKWQEYKREDIYTHKKLAYTDTLMFSIVNNKAEVKEGTSMTMNMKGEASIEAGNSLAVAGDIYPIISIMGRQMIIKDDSVLKTMKQVKKFYLETVGKDSVNITENKTPRNILLTSIMGKWSVYKKEAKVDILNDNTPLVYSIALLKDSTENIATGEIVLVVNNIQKKFDAVYILNGSTIEVLTDNRRLIFNTYKATADEFIFGKPNEVLHYAKRF